MNGQSRMIHNYFSVKQYDQDFFRLVVMKVAMFNGSEPGCVPSRDKNEFKLDESLIRARGKIFEYAMCNDFDYFITLTLNKEKVDRHDLDEFSRKLGQFIRDYRKRKASKIEYLLIPEKHKDGAWHIHGLIKGIPCDHLVLYTLQDKIPERMKSMIRDGRTLYWWPPYQESFGWVSMEPVMDKKRVAKYITKYITKSIEMTQSDASRKNKKLYYHSRGLMEAKKIKEGTFLAGSVPSEWISFENDYCMGFELTKRQYETISSSLQSKIIIPHE